MIIVAILLPPLAVLLCGKPGQAFLNCFLTLFGWIPGIIHAVIVVNNRNADRRQAALIAATEAQTAAIIAAQQAAAMPVPPVAPVPPAPTETAPE